MTPPTPLSSPVLDYENPIVAGRERRARPWPQQVAFLSGSVVALCAFLGPGATYEVRPLFILPMWMAAAIYILARILSSRARPWAKWHMAFAALSACVLSPFVLVGQSAPSVAADVLAYGWPNRYTTPLESMALAAVLLSTIWFATIQLVDWISRRRPRHFKPQHSR